jgi:hypothetical protein
MLRPAIVPSAFKLTNQPGAGEIWNINGRTPAEARSL